MLAVPVQFIANYKIASKPGGAPMEVSIRSAHPFKKTARSFGKTLRNEDLLAFMKASVTQLAGAP